MALALGISNRFPLRTQARRKEQGYRSVLSRRADRCSPRDNSSCTHLSAPRCPFTVLRNYDATGREHSFLYTVYYYLETRRHYAHL